jgi:hypothetical protein
MRVFLPAGTHLLWWVTGIEKFCTRWRVWVRVMSKIKGDGYGYGVVPPAPIPCGCHPYICKRASISQRNFSSKLSRDICIKCWVSDAYLPVLWLEVSNGHDYGFPSSSILESWNHENAVFPSCIEIEDIASFSFTSSRLNEKHTA